MSESLSQQLHDQTLNSIIERLNLSEVTAADGGPWLPLISQVPMVQGSLGSVRIFKGEGLTQLVTCTIVVPPIGLDSHMLFAFTDTECGIPHFTVDSVRNGQDYAFQLDPRQLAVMSPWMLVNRADELAFKATFKSVETYLNHWFSIREKGVSADALQGVSAEQLAARDAAHRAIIFNPEVDKVWNQITPLLGQETVDKIISLLRATRG